MNELEKQQAFTMQDLSEKVTNTPLRDNIYELEPLQEVKAPKFKTLTEAAREFRFRKEQIDDIQSAIEKEPSPDWAEKAGAGAERFVLRMKQTPAQVRNLFYKTMYQGIDYPNADQEQALDIAEASAYQMYLEDEALRGKQQREGTSDSIIANLVEGALSVGQFALLNMATGATAGTAIMGAQEAGSLSQQFAEYDIEKGQKGTMKDNLTAIAYGALAGWIEKGIGAEAALGQTWREILKSRGKVAATTALGKEVATRALGEGTEEFLQGEAEWVAGKFVGKEDRDVYDGLMDSLISGVYGAVLGGAFGGVSAIGENGVARYYKARADMIERMTNNGVDPDVAAKLADQALTDTTGLITDELKGRNSLHDHFGEQWDKLVDGVAQAYIAQGWAERFPDKDVNEFARMNAVAMVAPVIQLSNRTNMPLNQLLDLTKFRANQNALFIDLPNMDDPKALGLEVRKRKAEIKRLRGMPATNAKDTIKRLNEQIKVLETRIRGLGVYDNIQKARMDTKKATLDNNVLASTRPEIMADLGGIRQAEKGESFVYVGNNQVPVRYVVKPMAEVQASHIAGEANPNYTLKELQNRTRGTVTDDAILQNRAANLKPEELGISPNTQFGAPVVNKNGEVISGNGRIETLRRAYELGNTSYKEMLDKMGYNTEGIERPVLVRETVEDLTPEQQIAIAEASNVSETSAFDHARQAMNDAKLLKKGISDPLSFADELPVNERQAYIRENGQYDMLALQRRFDDAVLAWIIGDTKTFDSLVLSNRLSQKVVKGLSLQGGNIVDFSKNNPALGVKKDLRYALVKSASIKNRGQFIPSVQQQDIESGITFNADALLYAMTFSSNSSELSNFIGQYVQTHQGYIDSQKDSFLADSLPKLSKEDITNQVLLNNPLTASKFDKDGTCTDSNLKAVIVNRIPVENVGYGTIKIEPEESQLFQEQFNLANENARLDDIYPAYEGETININGKERTVYNSNGDRIAKSEQALRNFYKWFGDSKVVDKQGRPLVVYHGGGKFDTFKYTYDGTYYFTTNKEYAERYAKDYIDEQGRKGLGELKQVYLKVENPAPQDVMDRDTLDQVISKGYDGHIFDDVLSEKDDKIIRVFNPNQIKSTSNRGTYSESENIYYQLAGIGSKTADINALSQAYRMKDEFILQHQKVTDEDREQIRQQTGWSLSPDGSYWFYEISDKDAKLNEAALHPSTTTLGEILDHPKLYEAYPFLKDMRVDVVDKNDDHGGSFVQNVVKSGDGYKKVQYIVLNTHYGIDKVKSSLLHEVKHAIETKEDWYSKASKGTKNQKKRQEEQQKIMEEGNKIVSILENVGVKDLKTYQDVFKDSNLETLKEYMKDHPEEKKQITETLEELAYDLINSDMGMSNYFHQENEVTARNVSARSEMSEEELRKTPFQNTADVAYVLMDGKKYPYKTLNIPGAKITVSTNRFVGPNNEIFPPRLRYYYARAAMKKLAGKKVKNASLGNKQIEIRPASVDKFNSLLADPRKQAVVDAIPEMLEIAEFKPEKSYTQETERNIKSYWKADLPIGIDGDLFNAHLTVKEDNNGNYFYDLQIKESSQTGPATNPGVESLASDLSDTKDSISENETKVNTKQGKMTRVANNGDLFDFRYDSLVVTPKIKRGDVKDLYATHNMSLAGVRDALKMGGLAMPSLAMRKVGQGNINQFGDIVFVANEKLAAPSRSTEVYDRDAWTPNLSYAIRYDLKPEANTFVKKVLEKAGRERETSTYIYNIIENLTYPASNTMAMDLYDLDTGHERSSSTAEYLKNTNYLDWYDEHFTANAEPYLWTENASNTDMVRKKFTLDNMMKILRKQEKSGGGFIGDYIFDVYKLLNFRAQKFKNLKEIKKNRNKLVSREEQKEALDKLNEEFLALAEDLKKEGENYSFGDATYGLGLAVIQDNEEQMAYWLKDKKLQSDEKAIKKVKDFIEKMKNIPTDYFEAKPRKAVDFSEFSGVIIPEGKQYDEVARALERDHYLNVERVEKGNEAQYDQALRNIQANSETVFFQSAFAGSRVDYDRPSLEAIGSGEGNQAHGWGLYYALDKDVADEYRRTFTGENQVGYREQWNYKGKDIDSKFYDITGDSVHDQVWSDIMHGSYGVDLRERVTEIVESYKNRLEAWQEVSKEKDLPEEKRARMLEEIEYIKSLYEYAKNIDVSELKITNKGQVHEVDIPENPYLLDENKNYENQSDYVKEKLQEFFKDKQVLDLIKREKGKYAKSQIKFFFENKSEDYSKVRELNELLFGTKTSETTPENARLLSELLYKHGIKGITYDGRQDGRCFVIFNPADVKVIQKFYQRGKANINGYFDGELKTIIIGSSFNFGTLQHEFAHFFLKRVFDIYKTGAGTQEFNDWFSQLSSILDIRADQFALTTPQQEQFARMTEAYLFNKAEFPDGAKPIMQMFFDWCPKEYNELLTVGWKDDKGVYHNSVFNKESLDFFNDMYSLVPELSDSPLVRTFTNETNRNGTKLPATSEVMANRENIISENETKFESVKLEDEKPEVRQAYLDIQRKEDPEIEGAYEEAIEKEKDRKKTLGEKFTQYVRIGRGTNTREEMDELAQDYIKKHRENAERVAFGNPIPSGYEDETGSALDYVENNTGIDRAVLILNMMNEYAPNSPEYGQLYHNFAIYRSYASKSAGLTNDVNTNYYLKGYAEINKALQTRAALVKYGKLDNAVNLWKRDIDQFISKNIEKVYNTEPESAERDRAIQEFIDEAVATFGGDKALYQEEIRIKSAREKRAFIDWANRTVKKIAKGEISGIDQAKLLDLSIKAQKGASYIDSNNVDEAVAASRSIREWQDFVNQKGLPESFVDKIVGTYLPSAMLSSPSTHALNYISNKFNSLSVQLASRLHYGENVIDKSVLEQEYARLKAIYAESGHNISEDIKPDDVSRLHGEHWQFKKPESTLGYLAPMRLLGWSDFYFRAHTYLDVLARIATKDANGDPKKALELFNSYKMMNNTGRAKEARVEAIMTGHIAVFTRNGTLANISAGVRSWLDLINVTDFGEKGHKGLGTLIMPFAKVPSNIVGMGIKAIASPFKLLGKATGLKKDWTLEDSINLTNFGMYGAILGIYLMAGLDYEPPYEPPAKYDPKKPYDSIKIGNAWISVESFGALANPLRFTFTMIDLMRDGKTMQPALSRALQGLKKDIPFADVEFGSDYAFKKPVDWTINQTYNQMSKAVPAIVKKPIAGINRMIGWRIEQDSALTKKIARQYGLDGEQTSINDWLTWIYRGIKIER